jgi:hypothetical protein
MSERNHTPTVPKRRRGEKDEGGRKNHKVNAEKEEGRKEGGREGRRKGVKP